MSPRPTTRVATLAVPDERSAWFRCFAAVLAAAALVFTLSPARAADPALDESIRAYILEHPEVIVEALQKYEQRQRAEENERASMAVQAHLAELELDALSPVGGNPNGDVVVVEFFDYRCGFCKRVLPSIRKVLEEDPGVKYVFKEFPVLGEESKTASKAALAVWLLNRDQYVPYHVKLMTARGSLTQDKVLDLAAEVGADRDAVKKKMGQPEIQAMLDKNLQLAQSINVRGTPAFIIGGQFVPGAIDLQTLQSLIAGARSG
jgi:protein-disulfide isomerase